MITSTILAAAAIAIAIGVAVHDSAQAKKIRKSVEDIQEDLKMIKEKGWIRGAKGRFERIVPKQELVPGVTSELTEPKFDA